MAKNIKAQLAALLDTEPKHLDLHIAIVNPSGRGSWVAVVDLSGVRVVGYPGDDPTGAVTNLFDKLTSSRGYASDPEVRVALEMQMAGANLDAALRPELTRVVTVDEDDDDTGTP